MVFLQWVLRTGQNPPERMIRNMYEKLPQELKERGAFCLWKYEERDGNRTKVPYQTNGLCADSSNKATFTDYAIAVRHRAAYDGIGIGVFGDICAIDIDSCVEDGVLSDMAEDIIARMDTYTEYSPSGTGVRILFKASLPAYDKGRYYINNRQIKLEVYVAGYTSRFVTVTGNAISGTGIEERTDALTEVLEKYMRKAEKPVSRVTAPGATSPMNPFSRRPLPPNRARSSKPCGTAPSRTKRATARRMRPCVRCWRSGAAEIPSRWTVCTGNLL